MCSLSLFAAAERQHDAIGRRHDRNSQASRLTFGEANESSTVEPDDRMDNVFSNYREYGASMPPKSVPAKVVILSTGTLVLRGMRRFVVIERDEWYCGRNIYSDGDSEQRQHQPQYRVAGYCSVVSKLKLQYLGFRHRRCCVNLEVL